MTPMTHTLLITGALGRMRNISSTQMVLHGVVTADRIELEGHEFVTAAPISMAAAAAISKATAAPSESAAAASSDAAAPAEAASSSSSSSSTDTEAAAAAAAQPTAQQLADEMSAESIRISQAGGRLLRRERMSLTRRRSPPSASASEAALRAAQNVWVGTYLITHETVGEAPEDMLSKKMMDVLNTIEKEEPNGAENEAVMNTMMSLVDQAVEAAHQPRVVLSILSEIEIEFTPSRNFDEPPNTYVNIFHSDLIRFAELIDGVEEAEKAIAFAKTAKAFTLNSLGAAAAAAPVSPTAAAAGSANAVAASAHGTAAAASVEAATAPVAAAAASSEANAAEVALAPAAEAPREQTNETASVASAPSS
jgi:hypothetical protein